MNPGAQCFTKFTGVGETLNIYNSTMIQKRVFFVFSYLGTLPLFIPARQNLLVKITECVEIIALNTTIVHQKLENKRAFYLGNTEPGNESTSHADELFNINPKTMESWEHLNHTPAPKTPEIQHETCISYNIPHQSVNS